MIKLKEKKEFVEQISIEETNVRNKFFLIIKCEIR